RVGERGHHAREDRAVDPVGVEAAQREHLAHEHRVLVGGAGARALAAHVGEQRAPVEHPEARVGVADVDDQQHGPTIPRTTAAWHARYFLRTSMMPSRTGRRTLSTRSSEVARSLNAAIALAEAVTGATTSPLQRALSARSRPFVRRSGRQAS